MSSRPVHECTCPVCQHNTNPALVTYHHQVNLLLSRLDEAQRRWFVATLSLQPDNPSDERLSPITGLDEKTIRRGRQELQQELNTVPLDRQRHEGGGRVASEKKTRRSKPT